jgi:hypothetical protein
MNVSDGTLEFAATKVSSFLSGGHLTAMVAQRPDPGSDVSSLTVRELEDGSP